MVKLVLKLMIVVCYDRKWMLNHAELLSVDS